MEQSLMMIKPDAVRRNVIGGILKMVEDSGLRIAQLRMVQLKAEEAKTFYKVHSERPFYDSLCSFMSSGPIVALVVEGESAVTRLRAVVGATDPTKADPGTIRRTYGLNVEQNSVHASDSVENGKIESGFFGMGHSLK